MNNNVFINCPFDNEYFPLLKSIIFSVSALNLSPIISETTDSGANRLNQITKFMKNSTYCIHDISRMEITNNSDMPRFNMPFELGIDFGIKSLYEEQNIIKYILIFEKEKYRYQKVISDISGNDIMAHFDNEYYIIKSIRDWFKTLKLNNIPSFSNLFLSYIEFKDYYNNLLNAEGLDPSDINSVTFTDIIEISNEWITQNFN